nr:MAG TPA: hypothetical protein [Caudoviricetes sp.]DAT92220.1 MAG TPA: hypothetical protein [Caudoviricetes sp.]
MGNIFRAKSKTGKRTKKSCSRMLGRMTNMGLYKVPVE